MTEKWLEIKKGADFQGIAKRFGISPATARLIRNREVIGDERIERYLHGGIRDLYDPGLLAGADQLVQILAEKIREQSLIRIIGDYDIDGVMASCILCQGLLRCGAKADVRIPHRMRDGYGINEHLIDEAYREGVQTILTCDNGIAAIDEIAHAKELGMTVLVTDHHEIPYTEEDGVRRYRRSAADVIVNPKQEECAYPYKNLCGAAVAWKIILLLYESCGIKKEEGLAFLEHVAFATVGDVMDLTDENRILVREGLKRLNRTEHPGMRALIAKNGLEPGQITAYHIGFVLGPCVNASGRLQTARLALQLFLQQDMQEAQRLAEELVELNIRRRDMTEKGVEKAKQALKDGTAGEKVPVVFLPEIHESLAGIIAGRIREICHKPVFVLTKAEDGVKGSGRSIEEYSMYEELCKCSECFTKFGGHPMAAGISLREDMVVTFREKINTYCQLTDDDFIPKIKIDIAMPADYPTIALIREFELLAPFGKGNVRPQFADRNLTILRASVLGRNQNVLRLSLRTESGETVSAVYFGDIEAWRAYYIEKYGERAVEDAVCGRDNPIRMSIIYDPQINVYQGTESVQLVIRNYR